MKDTPSQVLIDSIITMPERLFEVDYVADQSYLFEAGLPHMRQPKSPAILAKVLAREINVAELPADAIQFARLEDEE